MQKTIKNEMVHISMKDLMPFIEDKLDQKNSVQLYEFKRLFISFNNLADQILHLYWSMKQKMGKHFNNDEFRDVVNMLDKSLYIISKMTQTSPICLDYNFYDKFIRTFDSNLNLLCAYYHSLSHMDIVNKEAKFEKEKIVEGINKLYAIHFKLKENFRNNTNEVLKALIVVTESKNLFKTKIDQIRTAIRELKAHKKVVDGFEGHATEFYESFIEAMDRINQEPEPKRNLIKIYFQLTNQLYTSQFQLQALIEYPLHLCESEKNKKKHVNFALQQTVNLFTRWSDILLKQNYSNKSIKKVKAQQYVKCVHGIIQSRESINPAQLKDISEKYEKIHNMVVLIIEIVKELEKVEQAGMMGIINEYKEALLPTNGKKFIHKLIDYQNEMTKFYKLHRDIKDLQKNVQEIALEELRIKLNVVINYEED